MIAEGKGRSTHQSISFGLLISLCLNFHVRVDLVWKRYLCLTFSDKYFEASVCSYCCCPCYVEGIPRFGHIVFSVWDTLHWLLIHQHIQFKQSALMCSYLPGPALSYPRHHFCISVLCHGTLSSNAQGLLTVLV